MKARLAKWAGVSGLMIGLLPVFLQGVRMDSTAARLDDLGFLAGTWHGKMDGALIEEVWTTPVGDGMLGMFRMISDGNPTFFEFMMITRTAEGIMLKIKHFNPDFVGWEEKEQSVCFRLSQCEPSRFVFRQLHRDTTLTYEYVSPHELHVTLKESKEGQDHIQSFRFWRGDKIPQVKK